MPDRPRSVLSVALLSTQQTYMPPCGDKWYCYIEWLWKIKNRHLGEERSEVELKCKLLLKISRYELWMLNLDPWRDSSPFGFGFFIQRICQDVSTQSLVQLWRYDCSSTGPLNQTPLPVPIRDAYVRSGKWLTLISKSDSTMICGLSATFILWAVGFPGQPFPPHTKTKDQPSV